MSTQEKDETKTDEAKEEPKEEASKKEDTKQDGNDAAAPTNADAEKDGDTKEKDDKDGDAAASANGDAQKDGDTKEKDASKETLGAQKKKDDAELIQRLQKLALERQKVNKHDRLKVIQSDKSSHLSSIKSFQELNLPKHLIDAIFAMGFDRPSAIQEEALPRILANPPRNLIGQAQSGSGKTAAFTLGMLYRTVPDSPATTQAICCTPTRELAIQIFEKALKPMAANMVGLKVQLAVAGTQLERGTKLEAHIVIGTPGKIVDWLKRKTISTKNIKVFVLDEADSMIEESGHRANSLLIKKQMPKSCQSLFFSATFPPEVVTFATKMVDNPDKILIETGDEFLVRWRFFSFIFEALFACIGHSHFKHTHVLYDFLRVGSGCDQAAMG
jgi:DEAD/DEAH box helicase